MRIASVILGFVCSIAAAQTNQWTWMGGSSAMSQTIYGFGQSGVYGTLGVSAAGNIPGGRYGASTWTDSSGNLWLFGGQGFDSRGYVGEINDLWEFNPSTNEWTWVGGSNTNESLAQYGVYGTSGVFAAGNIPGARLLGTSWTDSSGHLWLFGGTGFDMNGVFGSLNDLWEYNLSTNEWAWKGGSTTVACSGCGQSGEYGTLGTPGAGSTPGGRDGANSWTDSSGNLWLFGGEGYDAGGTQGFLNDLWKYNPSKNEWTWIGGSSTVGSNCDLTLDICGRQGAYGTLGTPAAENMPGGRWLDTSWTDSSGDFWLLGGWAFDANGKDGYLNDLWEFNPSTNEWAWKGGSSTIGSNNGQSGAYGTVGTFSAGNIPGSREKASSWTDSSGNLWLFAGVGLDGSGTSGYLNDLWEFNPFTNEWAWMGGSNTIIEMPDGNYSQPGEYGTLGAPAAANVPGGRFRAGSWTDSSGNFWLFGGSGYDAKSREGWLNDLWKYQLSTSSLSAAATPTFSPVAGIYTSAQSVTILDAISGAKIYYTTNGTTPTTGSTVYSSSSPIAVSSTETIEAIAAAGGYSNSAIASATYTITAPSFTLSASPTSVSVAQGSSGTSTITVTAVGGFSGNVTLAASGLPGGVTASFAAGSAVGTQVLTLAASTSSVVMSSPATVTIAVV